MYKAYHYMLPENIQRNFVKKDVNHRTRSKNNLLDRAFLPMLDRCPYVYMV